MLRVAQEEMLEILKEIDRICEKHKIGYWLDYGTLLGAVRHQGFIPWDDDCDIGMIRSEYRRFINIVRTELRECFVFQTHETDPKYPRRLTKIRSKKIKIVEIDERENEGYHQGVFVDIFVYDFYPESARLVFKILNGCLKYHKLRNKHPKHSLIRSFFNVTYLPIALMYTLIRAGSEMFWSRMTEYKMPYIGPAMSQTGHLRLSDKEDYFPLMERMEFERCRFPVPHNPDKILKLLYGDYMSLPELNDRKGHSKFIGRF